nr:MAG TPA: hypothetical protein [Bacteriophage sp.]
MGSLTELLRDKPPYLFIRACPLPSDVSDGRRGKSARRLLSYSAIE